MNIEKYPTFLKAPRHFHYLKIISKVAAVYGVYYILVLTVTMMYVVFIYPVKINILIIKNTVI